MNDEKILLVDKPAGWTSFDVVAKIRGKIRAQYHAKGEKPTKKQLRVGHAGTLDPFATGLVIILIGEACKQAGEFLKLDKTYEFTARLGEVSTTGDPEGEISEYRYQPTDSRGVERSESLDLSSQNEHEKTSDAVIPGSIGDPVDSFEQSESSVSESKKDFDMSRLEAIEGLGKDGSSTLTIPTEKEVLEALKQFEGVISQVPPAFSAIKINGQRAYKLAREGKVVEIPARQVTIYRIDLVEYNYPYLKGVCDVSSGTYIRTLVEDIGQALNVGAHCTELRRTRINSFQIENAQLIDKIKEV